MRAGSDGLSDPPSRSRTTSPSSRLPPPTAVNTNGRLVPAAGKPRQASPCVRRPSRPRSAQTARERLAASHTSQNLQGRRPSLRSEPRSRAASLDPDELLARVRQLERVKQEEEKERKIDEVKQKKEMVTAKNRLAVEIRAQSRAVRRSELEATKLARDLQLCEQKADRARTKRLQQMDQLALESTKAEYMCHELRTAWEEKVAQMNSAQNSLASAEMASKMLDLGMALPKTAEGVPVLPKTAEGAVVAILDSGADRSPGSIEQPDLEVHTAKCDRLRLENARLSAQVEELKRRLDSFVTTSSEERPRQMQVREAAGFHQISQSVTSVGLSSESRFSSVSREPTATVLPPAAVTATSLRQQEDGDLSPAYAPALAFRSSGIQPPSRPPPRPPALYCRGPDGLMGAQPTVASASRTVSRPASRFSSATMSPGISGKNSPAAGSACSVACSAEGLPVTVLCQPLHPPFSRHSSSSSAAPLRMNSGSLQHAASQHSIVLRGTSAELLTPRSLASATTTPGVASSAVLCLSPRSPHSSPHMPLPAARPSPEALPPGQPPVVVYAPWMAREQATLSTRPSSVQRPAASVLQPDVLPGWISHVMPGPNRQH
eukprot:TRINITY_DN24353_c0_g1_i2.p1 TRINITY_DN24353_c0_g1~~TRINITY_DN24353_c0_g1_i2.p1  ORF type:complete len:605 (+),score=105.12 TRINITY_DN24353_c0_g1_i2:48-1862(+)